MSLQAGGALECNATICLQFRTANHDDRIAISQLRIQRQRVAQEECFARLHRAKSRVKWRRHYFGLPEYLQSTIPSNVRKSITDTSKCTRPSGPLLSIASSRCSHRHSSGYRGPPISPATENDGPELTLSKAKSSANPLVFHCSSPSARHGRLSLLPGHIPQRGSGAFLPPSPLCP
jgi:hypothetical protein